MQLVLGAQPPRKLAHELQITGLIKHLQGSPGHLIGARHRMNAITVVTGAGSSIQKVVLKERIKNHRHPPNIELPVAITASSTQEVTNHIARSSHMTEVTEVTNLMQTIGIFICPEVPPVTGGERLGGGGGGEGGGGPSAHMHQLWTIEKGALSLLVKRVETQDPSTNDRRVMFLTGL